MVDQRSDRLWIGDVEAIREEKARRCVVLGMSFIALTVVAFLPLSDVGARLATVAQQVVFGASALITLALFARAGWFWSGRGSLLIAVSSDHEEESN